MPHGIDSIGHSATRLWTTKEDWDGNSQGWGAHFTRHYAQNLCVNGIFVLGETCAITAGLCAFLVYNLRTNVSFRNQIIATDYTRAMTWKDCVLCTISGDCEASLSAQEGTSMVDLGDWLI